MEKEIDLEQPETNLVEESKMSFERDSNPCEENFESGSKNIGKFKDEKALMESYNNLQSDYTKKCQLLAELQKQIKDNEQVSPLAIEEKAKTLLQEKMNNEEFLSQYIFCNEGLKEKVIDRYFEELSVPKAPKLISKDKGSQAVMAPVYKPHTFEEAEQIVKDLFKN